MTVFYPDISGYQAGIRITSPIVLSKATEGVGYENPDYYPSKSRAAAAGAFFGAYHFLHPGNTDNQARYCLGVVGKNVGLMLDFEPIPAEGLYPSVADAVNFIKSYRALGGICYFLYFPDWYYVQLGRPDLSPLKALGMLLVSSDYTGYSDSGPGWASYGGMAPTVWQYTSTMSYNGYADIDFNAFKGTVAQFEALFMTGTLTPNPYPLLQEGAVGPAVVTLQQRLNVWGVKVTVDGSFGPLTLAAVKAFQKAHGLTVDGIVGPATWAALRQTPTKPWSPTDWAYTAPNGLTARGGHTSVYLSWNPVTGTTPAFPAGQAAPIVHSYDVAIYHQSGGAAIVTRTATGPGLQIGSLPKGALTAHVWANGGPVAPANASVNFTCA